MWNLPGPGIKPMPLALAGRFLSTEPPGKPWAGTFLLDGSYSDTSALPLLGPDKCLKINVSWALFQVLWRCSITGALFCQWVAYSFLVELLTRIQLFVDPWTIADQAPLSLGFPRQEYWSGKPFPSPGHLPDPGMEPASPALAGRFFTTEPPGAPK